MDTEIRRLTARQDWIDRFNKEWCRLSLDPVDGEELDSTAYALYPIFRHRSPDEAAREYFQASDTGQAWANSPHRALAELAVQQGLIEPGAALPEALREFAWGVGELCAFIGDRYRDPHAGRAGDAIRAQYGRVPF